MSKNARECTAIVRQQVFSAVPYWGINQEVPGSIYDKFSRIDLTIIDRPDNGKRNFVSSSIHETAYPGIYARSKFAFDIYMNNKYNHIDESKDATSPAYTVQLTGKLKGKTPAAVLSEDPAGGKEILNNQYKWLAANADKYPVNKKQMEAILDASNLLKDGKLQTVHSSPVIEIYQALHGNPYKAYKNNPKLNFCHETKIVVNTARDYPVEITISNFWAPLIKDNTGRQTVDVKNAIERETVSMALTIDEWMYNMDQIETSRQRFLAVNANGIESSIVKMEQQARQERNSEVPPAGAA